MKKLSTLILVLIMLLQPVTLGFAWEIERPGYSIGINERTDSANNDGNVAVSLGTSIDDCVTNNHKYGGDLLMLNVSMAANSRMGLYYTKTAGSFSNDWVSEDNLYNRVDRTNLGEDWGAWVDIPKDDCGYPIFFRFFGGAGSNEYDTAWICSNGFIAFDLSNSTSHNPNFSPTSSPNAMVAAVWNDLVVDSAASVITGVTWDALPPQTKYFVITWNNVLQKSSQKRLTFQIKLENAPPYDPTRRGYTQSRIWVSWKNVSSIDTSFGFGIKDQEGTKSLGGLDSGADLADVNRTTQKFVQYSNTCYLKNMSLYFSDDNPNSRFYIDADPLDLRGNNLVLNDSVRSTPDGSKSFLRTLASSTMLLAGWGGIILGTELLPPPANLLVNTFLVTSAWYDILSQSQYNGVRAVDRLDSKVNSTTRTAHIKSAVCDYSVDSEFDIYFDWVLDDNASTGSHSLWICALADYAVVLPTGQTIDNYVATYVNLKIGPDNNNDFSTATPIQAGVTYSRLYIGFYDANDFYKLNIPNIQTYRVDAHANSLYSMKPNFELHVYDPSCIEWSSSTPANTDQSLLFIPYVSGDWFIKFYVNPNSGTGGFYSFCVNAYNNCSLSISNPNPNMGTTSPAAGVYSRSYGTNVTVTATPIQGYEFLCWILDNVMLYPGPPYAISITMNSNHSLTAVFDSGGGGCPYVSLWNGTRYVLDNSILPDSEVSGGRDTKDYYGLEQPLVPTLRGEKYSVYSLKISEFEHEHDYIDQVQVLAVDHPAGVNVAVSPSGEILTYKHPSPPVSAISNDCADVLSLLSGFDGKYYQGYNGSYVTVTFAATDVSAGAKLVVRADDFWIKCPIYAQVLNATGQWNTVASFDTRSNWATDIINMTGLLPDAEGNLRVRLSFVSTDEIDYVGLDTTPQANVQVHEAKLLHALSSWQGDVTQLLKADDEKYAELVPGQQILLTFKLPSNQNSERTVILYTEGHYQTIH